MAVKSYEFRLVDVFTREAFTGNPVGVVLGADGLTGKTMQRIASWMGTSETAFVVSPESPTSHYRLRIFGQTGELPFAGHPTIGAAHAVLESELVRPAADQIAQETLAGPVNIAVEGQGTSQVLFVRVPELRVRTGPPLDLYSVMTALGTAAKGLSALVIEGAPAWVVVHVPESQALQELRPNMAAVAELAKQSGAYGITVFALDRAGASTVSVRSFAPGAGVPEDPVCGSGNAAVAAYLLETGLVDQTGRTYTASQGRELGRSGRVLVRALDPRHIEIGGQAVTVVRGRIDGHAFGDGRSQAP